MPSPRSTPRSVCTAAAVALTLTSAGQALAWPFGHKDPPPAAEAPPAPVAPPAAPPPVALASEAIDAAGAYRVYMRTAAAISPSFANGAAIENSLAQGEGYEPKALSRGVIAYAALLALQDPSFVAGVRGYAVNPATRALVAQRISSDPYYATQMPGAPSAAGVIIDALNADGARVSGAGVLVKQAAYDIQHKKWSVATVPDRDGRLARAKTSSAAPMAAPPQEVAELGRLVAGTDAAGARAASTTSIQPAAGPYTPLVVRALALATLAALGMAGDDNDAAVRALLDEPSGGFCMNMAKLNLYQCLAVAKPYYEDVFCLGQHVLIDTGQCVTRGVGPTAAPSASLAGASARPISTASAAR